MYTKKILSAAAAVAIMATGAMAFDFTTNGTIVADITAKTLKNASYVGGVEANNNLAISPNNKKGDALIYPAFKTGGDGKWNSEIVVRNADNNATVCKVVLYAADNSRELLDFDVYLSPYDAFRFTIDENGNVSTNDGSFALVDPTLDTDENEFVKHNGKVEKIGNIHDRAGNEKVNGGYAIIYAMVEANNKKIDTNASLIKATDKFGAYHNGHKKLFSDFRKIVDLCRDINESNGAAEYNISTPANWRSVLGSDSAFVLNGTAIIDDRTNPTTKVAAPNVASNCLQAANKWANDKNDKATKNAIKSITSDFTSPSKDLLFGEVRISSSEGQARDLLISATALDNYTDDNQMMLWVPGEYAAIQDRRIKSNGAGYSTYDRTGINGDASTFNVKNIYYTFDANNMEGNNTLLITQPMKRALIMTGLRTNYWIAAQTGINARGNKWGEFKIKSIYLDENEHQDTAKTRLKVVTSPVSGNPEDAYKDELEVINDPERTETNEGSIFRKSKTNGFAIMTIGQTNGLPAIVTQMKGSVINGQAQTNWIYSTTDK